mmetsp:Transcript_1791/g.2943  ORF Transcript_1791/g.2943 Transcript_1791/m.2943 type:complete len:340 (-) Transcript_1791:445-1464(-)
MTLATAAAVMSATSIGRGQSHTISAAILLHGRGGVGGALARDPVRGSQARQGVRDLRGTLLASVDLRARGRLHTVQDLQYLHTDVLQVLGAVLVLHVAHRKMHAVLRAVVLEVVVEGQRVWDRGVQQHRGLVSPAARHIAQCVASTAEHQGGHVEGLDVADAVGVSLDGQLEAAQTVARETVRTALQHDGARLILLHDLRDDRLEDGVVALVVHAVVQRDVDGVALSRLIPLVLHIARAGKIFTELVERAGHDSVGGVEGLLHAVSVMDVDVDVQHALVLLQQLQDAQHAIVHVAEATRLALLGVVQSTGPVDHRVGHIFVQSNSTADRSRCRNLTELK